MASSRSRRTAQKTSSKRSATRRPKKAGTTKKKAKGRTTKASTSKKTTSRGSKAPAASAKRRTSRSGKAKKPGTPSKPRLGDARLDRRILDGMLHDREGLMRDMTELGYTMDDVVSRAADLGLSEALIRQVRGVAADLAGDKPQPEEPTESLAPRTCLSCDRVFLSNGPGNRLCMRCRGGDAGLAGV